MNISVKNMSRFWEILLHFIFPVSCPVCGKPGVEICPECRKYQHDADTSLIHENITHSVNASLTPENITHSVNASLTPENIAHSVNASPAPARILPTLFTGEVITRNLGTLTVYAATHYHEGSIRDIIHRLKYEGMRELGRPLGRHMAELFGQCRADVLIPVPLHLYSDRGYNQSRELAEGMRDFWGVEILDAALWTRDVPRRATSTTRSDITYEDFRFTRDVYGKRIALVDDVCTSGNTLSCLAESCRRDGAIVICAYTLASV